MLLNLRINSGRAVVFTTSFLSLPILTYIRTSQVLMCSEFSHCDSNDGLTSRKFTTDLAGVCQGSFAYCCHSRRVSERWRRALGLEPGLALWLACPIDCGGYNVLCFEKSLTSTFVLPIPKATREEVQWPCWGPGSRPTQTPAPQCQPSAPERLCAGPQWPRRVEEPLAEPSQPSDHDTW